MDAERESELAPVKSRTTVERKSERELVVTRTFNAPARIVFEAWTKPELLERWWAPKSTGVTQLSCEADVRALPCFDGERIILDLAAVCCQSRDVRETIGRLSCAEDSDSMCPGVCHWRCRSPRLECCRQRCKRKRLKRSTGTYRHGQHPGPTKEQEAAIIGRNWIRGTWRAGAKSSRQ